MKKAVLFLLLSFQFLQTMDMGVGLWKVHEFFSLLRKKYEEDAEENDMDEVDPMDATFDEEKLDHHEIKNYEGWLELFKKQNGDAQGGKNLKRIGGIKNMAEFNEWLQKQDEKS